MNISIDPRGILIAGAQLAIKFNKTTLNVNCIKDENLFEHNEPSTTFNNSGLGIYSSTFTSQNVQTAHFLNPNHVSITACEGKFRINWPWRE
jgi:hypothetical protein